MGPLEHKSQNQQADPVLKAHLRIERYGDFLLTDAIRPGLRDAVYPRQGYRLDHYTLHGSNHSVPMLAAAVTREKLFDVFMDMLQPLGDCVDVVLETSHDHRDGGHTDHFREGIELPILQSHCYDFEDFLLKDGCTGIAVLSQEKPLEVQFDEHKLLVVYGPDLPPFQKILEAYGVFRNDALKLITEGEHMHSTETSYQEMFVKMRLQLGIDNGQY